MNVSNISKQDIDVDVSLDIWNRELQRILIPNDVILIVFLILGIFGNGLVLIVYHKKIDREHSARKFIFDLALVDLVASVTCSASDLAMTLMPAKYFYSNACKGTWMFNVFVTGLSVFLLIIISIERYLKMCHPFGPHFTRGKQRLAMIVVVLVSVLYSIPPAFIYGSVPFQNPHGNLTGYRCSIVKSGYRRLAYAYGISLAVLAFIIVTSLVIMYSRIGFAVRSHLKRISKFRSLTSLDGSIHSLNRVNGNKRVVTDKEKLHVEENNQKPELKTHETEMTQSTKSATENAVIESSQNLVKPHAHVNVPQDAEDRELMLKFTIMFVLITAVFFICFATKGTIMVIEALDPYFWENINSVDRAIMILVYHLYIFSYVINPIIFAAFDGQFKYELKRLRSQLCRK